MFGVKLSYADLTTLPNFIVTLGAALLGLHCLRAFHGPRSKRAKKENASKK